MTGQWRVDRPAYPGNDTEWFGTDKQGALNREIELRNRGAQNVVTWFDMAEYMPIVDTGTEAAWAVERPVPLIERIRGLAGRTLRPEAAEVAACTPRTHQMDPSYTGVINGENGTIQTEAS